MRKKRYKYEPALEDATAKDKGIVVSKQRAQWKAAHAQPNEKLIRFLRFVWMRKGALRFEDRHKLHKVLLGAALSTGLAAWERDGREIYLTVSARVYQEYIA